MGIFITGVFFGLALMMLGVLGILKQIVEPKKSLDGNVIAAVIFIAMAYLGARLAWGTFSAFLSIFQ